MYYCVIVVNNNHFINSCVYKFNSVRTSYQKSALDFYIFKADCTFGIAVTYYKIAVNGEIRDSLKKD